MKFNFGNNWKNFVNKKLDVERINIAEESLTKFLIKKVKKKKFFLDIGSGSGLFSLAAKNLGYNVISIDLDKESVECTKFLKKKYFPNDKTWKILFGSILDRNFLRKIAPADIVYSWGVLHHTGQMWVALDNCIKKTKLNGMLFIAIYNDEHLKSRLWWIIKFIYNRLPDFFKKIYFFTFISITYLMLLIKKILFLDIKNLINYMLNVKKNRGMSFYYNILDWVGGFPYEFSSYENLKMYCQNRGLKVLKFQKNNSLGCHQIVFKKIKS